MRPPRPFQREKKVKIANQNSALMMTNLHTARECIFVKCVKMTRARAPKIGFWKMFPPSTTLARLLFSDLASWCAKRAWVSVYAWSKVKNYSVREFSGAKTPPGGLFVLETHARSSFFCLNSHLNGDEKKTPIFLRIFRKWCLYF